MCFGPFGLNSVDLYLVDTRCHFNVYMTSPTSYRRLIDVKTALCLF